MSRSGLPLPMAKPAKALVDSLEPRAGPPLAHAVSTEAEHANHLESHGDGTSQSLCRRHSFPIEVETSHQTSPEFAAVGGAGG